MQPLQAHIGEEQNSAAYIRTRDLRDLEVAVSGYLPMFYSRAYHYMRDPQDAEDAVQDALLSAYKHLDQFKGTAKMTTWLTTIVTNSALTKLRRRSRHPQVSLDERPTEEQDHSLSDRLADIRPSPESECVRSDLHGHLMQSVNKLSPSLRTAIQLYYVEGFTTTEVAHILGVPQGTVKTRVSRARTELKRIMRQA